MASKILFFIVCVFFVFNAKTQPALKHDYKYYQSTDGKLYYNKNMPVYVYISSQPDGKGEMIQLKSDSTKRFANPMYFDTEGYNSFHSPHAVDTSTKKIHYPLTDIIFELYSDSKSPVTSLKLKSERTLFKDNVVIIGSGSSFELLSTDRYSGVEQLLVSIDSSGYKKYELTIEFDKEKKYDINYYAVDNVGNIEDVHHKEYAVDLTSPQTDINIDGERYENTISGKSKIKLEANDNIAGVSDISYSIDGGKFVPYKYAINAAYLTEGDHILKYYSIDKVGNIESEKEFKFFVDKTAPVLVDEIMGNSYIINGKEYSSGRSKLKLTAFDNKAGVKEVKYSINKEPYVDYQKPFYLTSVSGALSVLSYAVDNVGNKSVASEKSTRNNVSYVDLTGPDIKYSFQGKYFKTYDATYINKKTKIVLEAIDTETGVKSITYSMNGEAPVNYTVPFSIEQDGAKEVDIYAYDNIDNSNRLQANFVVDNIGPKIFNRFSVLPLGEKEHEGKNYDLYPSHAVVFLSATDERIAIDKIYYSVNGGNQELYTGIVDGFKKGQFYTITVNAFDKLGNVNSDTVKFITDNTGPEVFVRYSVQSIANKEVDGEVINVYPSHLSIFISITNSYVVYDKIYYSINGSAEKPYRGIIDGFKPGDIIKMKIRAVDRLGNKIDKTEVFGIQK